MHRKPKAFHRPADWSFRFHLHHPMLRRMATVYGTLNDVSLHLSAAVLSLAGCMPTARPEDVRKLLRVGRLLASTQRRLRLIDKLGR